MTLVDAREDREGRRLEVAILGSGNIGTDLLVKVMRSRHLRCTIVAGRNLSSPGMAKARSLGVEVTADSIGYIEKNPNCAALVFDATSAADHKMHAPILERLGKVAIDLTPAKIGAMCVPAVNIAECVGQHNVNMVTCGGQASIPIAWAIGRTQKDVEYIEVVSSIASRSAGPATRANLDEYIHTTELGIRTFGNCSRSKAILNLNPAQPCINMQTTVLAKLGAEPDLPALRHELQAVLAKVQGYVPGCELLVGPTVENGRVVVMVRVRGLGDYLPAFAGNLDIINCAAVAMAEEYARRGARDAQEQTA